MDELFFGSLIVVLEMAAIILSICLIILTVGLVIKSPKGFKENQSRFFKVLSVSLFGAIVSGILDIYVSGLVLPPSDDAYSLGLRLLRDPFVTSGIAMLAIPVGAFLSPLYFACTLSRRLLRCALFVQTVAFFAVSICSLINPLLGFAGGIATVISALFYCKESSNTFFLQSDASGTVS